MPHPWKYRRPQMSTSPQTCYLPPKLLFPPKPLISMITHYSPAKSTLFFPPKYISFPPKEVFFSLKCLSIPQNISFSHSTPLFPRHVTSGYNGRGWDHQMQQKGRRTGGQRKQCRVEGMLTQGRLNGGAERRAFAVPF